MAPGGDTVLSRYNIVAAGMKTKSVITSGSGRPSRTPTGGTACYAISPEVSGVRNIRVQTRPAELVQHIHGHVTLLIDLYRNFAR